MQTSGLLMNNIWSHRVMRRTGVDLARVQNAVGEATVMVDAVTLGHHDSEMNYRPYLHASGDLISVVPAQPLPWDITEVSYDRGQERISAFYEFTDDQLESLVTKGYFSQDFVVPEEITGIPWQLPVTVDAVVVGPSGLEDGTNAAIVFLDVHDAADLKLDRDGSGYDLAEYFADRSRTSTPQAAHKAWTPGRQDVPQGEALFAEEELALDQIEDPRRVLTPQDRVQGTIERSDLDVAADEVSASIDAEQADYQAALAARAGTDENLYAAHVASYLDEGDDEGEQDEGASANVHSTGSLKDEMDRIGMQDEESTMLFDDELDPADVEAARSRRTARRQQNIAQALRRPDGTGVLDQIAPEQGPGQVPEYEADQPQPGA